MFCGVGTSLFIRDVVLIRGDGAVRLFFHCYFISILVIVSFLISSSSFLRLFNSRTTRKEIPLSYTNCDILSVELNNDFDGNALAALGYPYMWEWI